MPCKSPIAITSLVHGWFEFTPQADITISDLAICVKIVLLNEYDSDKAYQEMISGGVSRHFTQNKQCQIGGVREEAGKRKNNILPGERDKEGVLKQVEEWEKKQIEELEKP